MTEASRARPSQSNIEVRLGSWAELRDAASAIRTEVFVVEQGVPLELEVDAHDPECLHALAHDATGVAIATGRLLPDAHIGRMAVLKSARGSGAGAAVLTALMDAARQRGDREVVLSAQTHAIGFYRRFGFVAYGEQYLDCDIWHVDMRCAL